MLRPFSCRATGHQGSREGATSGVAGDAYTRRPRVGQTIQTSAPALLKNPGDLTVHQAVTLRELKRKGGDLWRAYALKGALRAIFAGDLSEDDVGVVIDRFRSRASGSGFKPFVTEAKTIRKRKEGILAAVRLGISNAQHKGLNRRFRLIVEREIEFSLGQCRPRPHHAHPRVHHQRPSP
jgi:transposase